MAAKMNPNNENNENKNNQNPENNEPQKNQENKQPEPDNIIIDKNGNIVNANKKKGLKPWVKIALALGALLIISGGVIYLVYRGKKIPVTAVEKAAEVATNVVEAAATVV